MPEFLRAEYALEDTLNPNRIIIGLDKKLAKNFKFASIFANLLTAGLVNNDIDILYTGFKEAESIKLFSNTYLAMRVAFFNELDGFAEMNGLDSREIIYGVSLDNRIGNYYNTPSFGYGGYCLPKDTKQLETESKYLFDGLIGSINYSNERRKQFIVNQVLIKDKLIIGIFKNVESEMSIVKGDVNDEIIESLYNAGKIVLVYDPSFDECFECNTHIVINDIVTFKKLSEIILANRYNRILDDVSEKVYSRDYYYDRLK